MSHVRGSKPTYVDRTPRMQSLKNRPTYARTALCKHESKLHTQARAHACRSTNRSSFSTFSSIHHPKSILNMFLPLLRCQVFIWTHPTINPKHLHGQKHIKMKDQRETWKWEKSLKTYRFSHGDVILWLACQWWKPHQSHYPTLAGKVECIKRKDVKGLLVLRCHWRGWREFREKMRE